jgi:hypothetical protein
MGKGDRKRRPAFDAHRDDEVVGSRADAFAHPLVPYAQVGAFTYNFDVDLDVSRAGPGLAWVHDPETVTGSNSVFPKARVQPREFMIADLFSWPNLGDWFRYPFFVFMFALALSALFSVRYHLAWIFIIPAGLICLTAALMSYTFDDAPDE